MPPPPRAAGPPPPSGPRASLPPLRRPAPEPPQRRACTAPHPSGPPLPAAPPPSGPALPTSPHLHSRRLALPPPRPATLSAQAATHLRKAGAGRLQQLHAASCCNNSAPAAGTSGGSASGSSWHGSSILRSVCLMLCLQLLLAVTSAMLTLAGDLICQLRPPPDSDMGEGGEEKSFNFLQVLLEGSIAGGTAGVVVEIALYPKPGFRLLEVEAELNGKASILD
ncbi:proline-rich receptor-like protein kinase PERK10 [Panicum hallii]|uniref:proline-rich receptor-like protein kinase PERK10 n=1 Tax=Panicum hallii TaxID=206008 RepID=UPI000DF4D7E7|nr:proline-rich receptor-like protein kinase PERK10 [Panicum hallii]